MSDVVNTVFEALGIIGILGFLFALGDLIWEHVQIKRRTPRKCLLCTNEVVPPVRICDDCVGY